MKDTGRILLLGILAIPFLLSNSPCSQSFDKDNPSLDEAIERIRKGTIYLKGKPGETVSIQQVKHEFWFGCAISSGVFSPNTKMSEEDIRLYKEKFLENFNSGVTENAVK
jgi:endo-1,4-beta-xylanase